MIFQSPYAAVEIPNDIALIDYLFERARRWPDKPAYIEAATGIVRTFSDVIAASERAASGFAEQGLTPGEVVAIYSPNTFDWPIAYYGLLRAGAVVTTVNPLLTANELRRQLDDTGATMIVTTTELMGRVAEADETGRLRQTFVFGDTDSATSFGDLLASRSAPPQISIDPASVCLLPTSSGTTGLPKSVMLTHQSIVANTCQMIGAETWRHDDILLSVLPLFHAAGFGAYLHIGFATGATTVLMDRFDLGQLLANIERYRVTSAIFVPPILLAMSKSPLAEQYDLSSMGDIVSGAAPVGRELGELFTSRFGCDLREVYGMTEASPGTHLTRRDKVVLGSAGPLIPNTEGRIVDLTTGEDLGPDQRGELWIRGPQVMRGYLNRPDATAVTISPEGWLRTGDVCYADEDGYFYFVDRVKELIKYKAYQVAPAELEDVLKGHPAISDAAVIGVADEDAGELPKAFVVCAGEVTEDEIITYVAERVAPYKKVRLVEFTDAIPKTASGKILRRELIERERGLVTA